MPLWHAQSLVMQQLSLLLCQLVIVCLVLMIELLLVVLF